MRRQFLLPLALLAACGPEPEPAEEPASLSTTNITLQPIGWPDIEKADLFGAGCSFAEGKGIATHFVAMDEGGYFKKDGALVMLSADANSPELPYLARQVYSNEAYWVQLTVSGEGRVRGPETTDYDGALTIRDGEGQLVYSADGMVECGA